MHTAVNGATREPHSSDLAASRIRRGCQLVDYQVDHVSPDMSFLETLDILNEGLILRGEEPIAFDHDCARASAVLAASSSTDALTARNRPRRVKNGSCIGCGARVVACPNGSAVLLTSAKIAHLNALPRVGRNRNRGC